jgi:hypothetical protein
MMSSATGPILLTNYSVHQVKDLFLRNGFYDPTPLQTVKPGQVFGVVKKLGQLETHVRGYADNTLDSEIELSRDYLEHPGEVMPYYGLLLPMLASLGVAYKITRALPPDPPGVTVPQRLTPWKPIAAAVGVAVGIGVLAWLFGNKDD